MSQGCGRNFNGAHKVEGAPLKCGTKLYWKVPGKDKERKLEIHLCNECKKEE